MNFSCSNQLQWFLKCLKKNGIAVHAWSNEQHIDAAKVRVFEQQPIKRKVMESLFIRQHAHSSNLDDGMNLSHIWKSLLTWTVSTHSFILSFILSFFCLVYLLISVLIYRLSPITSSPQLYIQGVVIVVISGYWGARHVSTVCTRGKKGWHTQLSIVLVGKSICWHNTNQRCGWIP